MIYTEIEQTTAGIIQRHFDLEEMPSDASILEKIRLLLIDKLGFLLDHNLEKLFQILYRIDVSEEKAHEVLSGTTGQKPAVALADLIIERQMEKARTRQEFSRRKNPGSP